MRNTVSNLGIGLDVYLKEEVYRGTKGLWKKMKRRYWDAPTNAVYLIRKQQLSSSRFQKDRCRRLLARRYGIFVGDDASIGLGLRLPHPNGIVIGQATVIGGNCLIFQQVTIGSARVGDVLKGLQPHIGEGCVLFSGAKVIGDIQVGDDVKVGANAVLLEDAPSGSTCVGIPARVITR